MQRKVGQEQGEHERENSTDPQHKQDPDSTILDTAESRQEELNNSGNGRILWRRATQIVNT